MNYAQIRKMDICNGPGVRVSLFTQGCARAHFGHPCPGCFNASTWDPNKGRPFSAATRDRILDLVGRDYIAGLSILGGEPLDTRNVVPLIDLCTRAKAKYPDKTIWLWTGFTFEQLQNMWGMDGDTLMDLLFANLDVVVDGPFIESQKDRSIRFRGSRNQRALDAKASAKQGRAIEVDID